MWKSWRKVVGPVVEYGSYLIPHGGMAAGAYKIGEKMQQDEAARVAKEAEAKKAILAASVPPLDNETARIMQNLPITERQLVGLTNAMADERQAAAKAKEVL